MSGRFAGRTSWSLAVLAAVLAGAGLAPVAAGAAPDNQVQWSVSPAAAQTGTPRQNFTLTLAPGAVITDYVAVANPGSVPLNLKIYATDALNTAEGAFTLLPADQHPTDLGAWISTGVTDLTVPPGQQIRVPFTLRVPANASPGDHAAGIVASRLVPATGAGNAQVMLDQRVGTRVYLRVDGKLAPALTVTSLDLSYGAAFYPVHNSPAVLRYQLKNTGNVQLTGTATVHLGGPFGTAFGHDVRLPVTGLLPGNTLSGSVTLPGAAPLGLVSARLRVTSSGGSGSDTVAVPVIERSDSALALPWLLLAVLVALIVGVVLRRRAKRPNVVTPGAKARPVAVAGRRGA